MDTGWDIAFGDSLDGMEYLFSQYLLSYHVMTSFVLMMSSCDVVQYKYLMLCHPSLVSRHCILLTCIRKH